MTAVKYTLTGIAVMAAFFYGFAFMILSIMSLTPQNVFDKVDAVWIWLFYSPALLVGLVLVLALFYVIGKSWWEGDDY